MKIDWERRYALMRLHFAAELVLETTYRTFPSIDSLPYKCHCEAVFAEAISYFAGISAQKGIAAPPKSKSGGSQ